MSPQQSLSPVVTGAPAAADEASHAVHARFYRPELDCLRFFAFWAVFVHHTLGDPSATSSLNTTLLRNLKCSAGFGLSLFFLLSSYLLTTLMLKEKYQTGTLALKAFFQRRILRIWPLYFSYLAIAVLVGFT